MPENTYIQQAVASQKQQQATKNTNKIAAEAFRDKMRNMMVQQIYNSTCSNLGF